MPTLRPSLLLLACVLSVPAVQAAPSMPAAGVWEGSIGSHPIMLCAGPGRQLTYRYLKQESFITLAEDGDNWNESVNDETTGSWHLTGKDADTLVGTWSAPDNKKRLPLSLRRTSSDGANCGGPAAVAPSTTRLALPAIAQLAASESGAVVRIDGSLWTWGEDTRNVPVRSGSGYVQVAVARSHRAALKTDGSLWAWGGNANCQLGGNGIDGARPVQIGSNFKYVAVADEYTFGIKADGSLWSWGGMSPPGKFGDGPVCPPKPTLLGTGFTVVSARARHFAALKADGTLWMWGDDSDGKLGIAATPESIARPSLLGRDFAQVSVGYAHTAALKKDGSLWTWGHNSWGQLGDGTKETRPAPVRIGDGYVQLAAGYLTTAAVKADGSLWAWGENQRGMMGDCGDGARTAPTKVATEVARVEAGQHFLLAARRDGSIWTWGWFWDADQADISMSCRKGMQVVFGNGIHRWDQPAVPLAAMRALPAPPGIAALAAAGSVTAVLKTDGSLWTWGNNVDGQLADGSKLSRNTPLLAATGIRSVSAEAGNLTVVKQDGSAWRWGAATVPGDGPYRGKAQGLRLGAAPVQVGRGGYQQGRVLALGGDGTLWDWQYATNMDKPPVTVGHDVRAISTGQFGSFALRKDGSLWRVAEYPVNVPALVGRDFVRIVAGADHAYGIKADGSLWAWGSNDRHQLGVPTGSVQVEPVQVGSGYADIAGGRFHGLALKRDGTLWGWGMNETGAVGDGTTTGRRIPVQLGSGFALITAGDFHSAAFKSDGTLWTWGSNEDGQLGDGANLRRLAPVRIELGAARQTPAPVVMPAPLPGGATQVAVGSQFACALLVSGQVTCWGRNQDGQLGQRGPNEANPVPQLVPGVAGAVAIATMSGRTCALQKNGHAMCWGQGETGVADGGEAGADLRRYLATRVPEAATCKMFKSGNITGHCSEVCTTPAPAKAKAPASFCERAMGKFPYLRGAAAVVSDSRTYCGLMKNGRVQCMSPEYPETGPVDGVHDAIALELDERNGCAVQRDGRVKCWGNNDFGQLGNGKVEANYDSHPPAVTVSGIAN